MGNRRYLTGPHYLNDTLNNEDAHSYEAATPPLSVTQQNRHSAPLRFSFKFYQTIWPNFFYFTEKITGKTFPVECPEKSSFYGIADFLTTTTTTTTTTPTGRRNSTPPSNGRRRKSRRKSILKIWNEKFCDELESWVFALFETCNGTDRGLACYAMDQRVSLNEKK